jgi:hypothetical protein
VNFQEQHQEVQAQFEAAREAYVAAERAAISLTFDALATYYGARTPQHREDIASAVELLRGRAFARMAAMCSEDDAKIVSSVLFRAGHHNGDQGRARQFWAAHKSAERNREVEALEQEAS